MYRILIKNKFFKKIEDFKSFFILVGLLGLSVSLITIHENYKNDQIKKLENFIQNTYLQKTLSSISNELEPRYEKINFIVNPGDSLKKILSEIELSSIEQKKILDFILSNKIKLNLREDQKVIFEIDNLGTKKLKKSLYQLIKKNI